MKEIVGLNYSEKNQNIATLNFKAMPALFLWGI